MLRFPNKNFDNFIKAKLNKNHLTKLKTQLKNSLNIPLTKKGFVNAAKETPMAKMTRLIMMLSG